MAPWWRREVLEAEAVTAGSVVVARPPAALSPLSLASAALFVSVFIRVSLPLPTIWVAPPLSSWHWVLRYKKLYLNHRMFLATTLSQEIESM
ncbi:hypothetical protein Y1Q_0014210 [Alligator mississippiensis]|uniref:Uncharacterized protein n=1 Tax=Alligator mississippiensis TaxID=8496 RepID=A0A151MU55_ALLMI|nr:hypothetical protein Y1Q_0014210 [Alligator mississippiensis]